MRSPFRCDSLRLSGKKSFEVYRPRDRTVSFTLGEEYEDVGALNQRPIQGG
jgi:quinol monooxygenase YgiN